MPTWLRRIARDDSGQDVVEYALLTLFVLLAAVAAWPRIFDLLGLKYGSTTSSVYELWGPLPPPGGS